MKLFLPVYGINVEFFISVVNLSVLLYWVLVLVLVIKYLLPRQSHLLL